jgi:hypothetical protein
MNRTRAKKARKRQGKVLTKITQHTNQFISIFTFVV